jgi:8-oxo-dGTP diphosphatase
VVKQIEVACAIIEKDGLVLAAQRNEAMSFPLKWEFPGGKLDPHESPAACLEREIWEEMGIGIRIHVPLLPSVWRYPTFAIRLHPFLCTMISDDIRLAEHKEIRWLAPNELPTLDWAEAEVPVFRSYLQFLAGVPDGD